MSTETEELDKAACSVWLTERCFDDYFAQTQGGRVVCERKKNRHQASHFYFTFQSTMFTYYFKNECECFIGVSNTRKLMKAWGHRPSAFIVSECLKPRWNTKHEFLKLLMQQKKISLNYHLNKFSQFSYYIWDVKYAWTSKQCVWCAWFYHLIAALWQFLNIQQLRSRYLAVCQFRANTLLLKANGRMQI